MASILSTKILTNAQRELVLNSGHSITTYDALKINSLNPTSVGSGNKYIIITSSNSINYLQRHYTTDNHIILCVGYKTAQRLNDMGFTVKHVAASSKELASLIEKNLSQESFLYLSGTHYRDELPDSLMAAQIKFKQLKVYESQLVTQRYDRTFDAVLCYSPRGVSAFAKAENQPPKFLICIGNTTAAAAVDLHYNVITATKQTIENVIVTAIKTLNND